MRWPAMKMMKKTCGQCGIEYGIPRGAHTAQALEDAVLHCPNGHSRKTGSRFVFDAWTDAPAGMFTVVTCPWCTTSTGLTKETFLQRKRDLEPFHCCNGHEMAFIDQNLALTTTKRSTVADAMRGSAAVWSFAREAPPLTSRIGDSERNDVVTMLSNAFQDGQLTLDEFEERSTAAMAARTKKALAPLTADLTPITKAPVPKADTARLRRGPVIAASVTCWGGISVLASLRLPEVIYVMCTLALSLTWLAVLMYGSGNGKTKGRR
jgi:hypothetical protein